MSTKRDEICVQYIQTEAGFEWQAFFVNRSADSATCQALAREHRAPLAVYSQTPELAQAQKTWVQQLVDAGTLKYLKSWVSKTGHKYATFVPNEPQSDPIFDAYLAIAMAEGDTEYLCAVANAA